MSIDTDLAVGADKIIRWTGGAHGANGTGYHTAIAVHRFLGRVSWQLTSSGDDYSDISRATPSARLGIDNIIELLNGYTLTDEVAEHIYDGTIIQGGGSTIYDGVLVYANPGMDLQMVQNGAVVTNDFWNNTPYGAATPGLNADASRGISHRFVLKVRDAGTDIDGRALLGQTGTYGYTYSRFRIPATNRGNNVLALTYEPDLNNQTSISTVAGWTTITNTHEGYTLIDVNNDGADEEYYSAWDLADHSINDLYERTKWLCRTGTSSTLYGLNGELFRGITHEVACDAPTGTAPAFASASWTGGTGQMLAINHATAPTKFWMQLLTGSAPTDNQVVTFAGGATVTVNGAPVERTLSSTFIGQSTGAAIIGAYGVGVEALDLGPSDSVKDLTNTQRKPPNYVTFSVNGLVSGEDVVLVGPATVMGLLDEDQLTVSGTLNGSVTSITVSTLIPTDTPASGTLRVELEPQRWKRVVYTSYNGSTFTIEATSFTSLVAPRAHVSYIDCIADASTEPFTTIFLAQRSLFVRVRDGGVVGNSPTKTYESVAALGASGGSITVLRQSDE